MTAISRRGYDFIPAIQSPFIIHESADLLVVNKPAGWNTHSPDPLSGEGLYEWLRNREPRWANLAIIHRLDKETSGLIVFSKTSLGNRSLSSQFEQRGVRKRYLALTDRPVKWDQTDCRLSIIRRGDHYAAVPTSKDDRSASARTEFRVLSRQPGRVLIEATPHTGRTHQIRVHAAHLGVPLLGDTLYGGTPFDRVCLQAAELGLRDPQSNDWLDFKSPPEFDQPRGAAIRNVVASAATSDHATTANAPGESATSACRLIHGSADGWEGCFLDRLGRFALIQHDHELSPSELERISTTARFWSLAGVYAVPFDKGVRRADPKQASPKLIWGEAAPAQFEILENGVRFNIRFQEGISAGLFLDQRDNRRRLISRYVAPGMSLDSASGRPWKVLNTFAYTCGFSVCAALSGAQVTSVDLSKKYLEWGQSNFQANQLDPSSHSFLHGDVFGWLKRFHRRGVKFDLAIVDPPTFSHSRESGTFRIEQDMPRLLSATVPLLSVGGWLFASCNTSRWAAAEFLNSIREGIKAANRVIKQEFYAPQPPDFPITPAQPAYLKTVWMRID